MRTERQDTLAGSLIELAKSPLRNLNRLRHLARFAGDGDERDDIIWAVRDVSFEIERGEVVGIIGRNGAGKSTLLKLLTRITEPTRGRAEIYGRVSSLLEVGTGFHPELTGRENLFLNGAILGMTRREIEEKFDAIVDFSGVGKFIDTPVKRYSSGMSVRLAFSVAAHLEPEVLLVDEVLAVGDVEFQKKCLGKMEEVVEGGRTILFVSHNMASIQNLCERTILLDHGRLVKFGETSEVIGYYLEEIMPSKESDVPLLERTERRGNGKIRFSSFHLEDSEGKRLNAAQSGLDTTFVFGFDCSDRTLVDHVDVGFSVHKQNNDPLFVFYSSYAGQKFRELTRSGYFRCKIPGLPLKAGEYPVHARMTCGGDEADWPLQPVGRLIVETGDFYGSGKRGWEGQAHFLVSGSWEIERQ